LLIGAVIESVLVSAVEEDNVHVVTPLAFVAPQAVCELFDPLALKVGVVPITGLLKASKSVTVTVEVATPLAMTGPEPVMVEVATAAAPAVNVTVPSAFTIGVVMESVLISAFVEVNVQVATPEALVAEHALVVFTVPLAVKVGVVPTTGLLLLSSKVMVTVEVATPSAVTGLVPVMLELAIAAESAVKITVPSAFTNGVAIDNVLISALVLASVQVASPEAFVTEHAEAVLFVPLAVKVGV
jgi:hypothetical protein